MRKVTSPENPELIRLVQLQNPWGLTGAEKQQRFPRGLPNEIQKLLEEIGPEKAFWVTYKTFVEAMVTVEIGAASLHLRMGATQ